MSVEDRSTLCGYGNTVHQNKQTNKWADIFFLPFSLKHRQIKLYSLLLTHCFSLERAPSIEFEQYSSGPPVILVRAAQSLTDNNVPAWESRTTGTGVVMADRHGHGYPVQHNWAQFGTSAGTEGRNHPLSLCPWWPEPMGQNSLYHTNIRKSFGALHSAIATALVLLVHGSHRHCASPGACRCQVCARHTP